MAIEKRWAAIAPKVFTSNGTVDGEITVSSTDGFKVKQSVILRANTLTEITLQVKAVLSETQLKVGLASEPIHKFSDISTFTTALNSTIEAPEQVRPAIPDKEYERASYEEEPTVAKRVISVDKLGRAVDTVIGPDGKVRLATDTAISVTGISVDLDAVTPPTKPDPDNILIVGSEDGTKTGIKRAFVNNVRLQILAAQDRVQTITYADFGTKNQRVTRIDYSSVTFPGIVARKEITYTQVGNRYRRDDITWSMV
jgi:hypothetical protein